MSHKIAVCITTFLRDTLLYKTIQTIVDNYTDNLIVLIADQGYADKEKAITMEYFSQRISLEYHRLPFDCGLSAARNALINRAHQLEIPYILMSADSIQFTQSYDFSHVISFLEADEKRGLVGFELENSKMAWEFLMNVTLRGIELTYPTERINFNNIDFIKVDICRNIFLAKTHTMLNLYDEDLKLGEHELSFLEYKKRAFEAFWTKHLSFKRNNSVCSKEYRSYRNRLSDYLSVVKQKLNISGWVIYPKNNEKRKH